MTILVLPPLVHLAWRALEKKDWPALTAFAFVIVGAFSNLLDRLTLQAVVDYIYLQYFSILNLADIMISLGLLAIILLFFRPAPPPSKI